MIPPEGATGNNGLDSCPDYNHRVICCLSHSTRASSRSLYPNCILSIITWTKRDPLNCSGASGASLWNIQWINVLRWLPPTTWMSTMATMHLIVQRLSAGFSFYVKRGFKLHSCTWHLRKRTFVLTIGVRVWALFQTHRKTMLQPPISSGVWIKSQQLHAIVFALQQLVFLYICLHFCAQFFQQKLM